MKYLISSQQFESLGVVAELDPLVQRVQRAFRDGAKRWTLETSLRGQRVEIEFELDPMAEEWKGQELDSYFQLVDPEELKFFIKLGNLEEGTIAHELKHVDRAVAKGLSADFYYYLNQVGREVLERLPGALRGEAARDFLAACFYYLDPEESEAYYNDLYREARAKLEGLQGMERRAALEELLDGSEAWNIHRLVHEKGFRLTPHFRDPLFKKLWLQLFLFKLGQWSAGDPGYDDWSQGPPSVATQAIEKLIERKLNAAAERGWRRFARIWSLL